MIDLNKKKVLIVRLGKIGDIVISSFVFEVLKKRFPEIEISLITLESNDEVLKYNSDIDHLILTRKNLALYFKIIQLRKSSYDLLIDLNDDPSTTSKIIRRIITAHRIVGFSFNDESDTNLFPQPSKEKTHIIERISYLLNKIGIDLSEHDVHPKLYLGKTEESEVAIQLKEFKKQNKIIVLNISAGAEIRYWQIDNWIKLINRLCNEFSDFRFLPLCTINDNYLVDMIYKKVDSKFLIEQKYKSFQHFASYIYNGDLLISPDTSAVHIASAFNKPVVAIYPNYDWNYISWKPLSEKFIAIKSKSNLINAVSVDEVYSSVMELSKVIFL